MNQILKSKSWLKTRSNRVKKYTFASEFRIFNPTLPVGFFDVYESRNSLK